MPQSATHTEILKRMHVWIWLRLCFIFPNRSENCGRIFLFFFVSSPSSGHVHVPNHYCSKMAAFVHRPKRRAKVFWLSLET